MVILLSLFFTFYFFITNVSTCDAAISLLLPLLLLNFRLLQLLKLFLLLKRESVSVSCQSILCSMLYQMLPKVTQQPHRTGIGAVILCPVILVLLLPPSLLLQIIIINNNDDNNNINNNQSEIGFFFPLIHTNTYTYTVEALP